MTVEPYITEQTISLNNIITSNTVQEFLRSFENVNLDFRAGTKCNIQIQGRDDWKKINPIIRMATIEDIDEIIFIYKDIYDNSYPYKEMEDAKEIKKMIKSPNIEWLIFETNKGEIMGCFTFVLDFKEKIGYIRGFNIKKKFLGKMDVLKASIGSFIAIYRKYKGRIFRWYGESRTAHSKSQYFLRMTGFLPIAFFPCKDKFYDKVESDILIICYDERALRDLRCKKKPVIIPEVESCFKYSNDRYQLGISKIVEPKIALNSKKLVFIKKNLIRNIYRDKFGYTDIKLSIKNSDSYFKFLYTPTVQNFEKTKYKVNSLEELFVFAQEFAKLARDFKVRYFEVYISAYKPKHQKIFRDIGLFPRGYVPSWKYNPRTGTFEDYILFNYNRGNIDKNIQLLNEGKSLLKCLNYNI
ncbi:MAG: hypothetical protein ACTSQJ_11690 [Promethearchaeota archaeon]